MKLYCQVENNIIKTGPIVLPPSLQDKSDFDLLDLGWYYAECTFPESFVDRYEIMLPPEFVIQTRKIICNYSKREKTQEELNAQNLQKKQEVELDKNNRLHFVNEFMKLDSYNQLSDDIKQQWVMYAQQVAEVEIENLGDDIFNVNFPHPPFSDL